MQPNLKIFLALLFSLIFCGVFYYLGMMYLNYQIRAWAAYLAEPENGETTAEETEEQPPQVVLVAVPAGG